MRGVMVVPDAATLLCAANLMIVASLPRVFFRRGRLNADWWFTAAPFALAGAALLLATVGLPTSVAVPALTWVPLLAVPFASASILLIGFTLGTHREPVSLWHQPDDMPARLVTHGAYARIRHPFYAAFLLALAACVLAVPGLLTVTAFGWAVIQLTRTARREERRLLASSFGGEYATYMSRTGRFVPLVRRSALLPAVAPPAPRDS